MTEDTEDVRQAVGVPRDSLSISNLIHKPAVVKHVVRHVGPSVGPSEVVRELTEDVEDVGEATGVPRDSLSISNLIHKPDREDIDGYRLLIHNLRENSKLVTIFTFNCKIRC